MSIAAMAYVWEHSTHKGNELILLLAIADFANEHGKAWPGIKTLAARVRVNERTAQRCLARVVASGELRIDPCGGPKGCHLYQVVMTRSLPLFDDQPAPQPVEEKAERGGGNLPPGELPGVTFDAKRGDTAVSSEPSGSISKRRDPGQAKASPVAACFEAYQHGIRAVHKAEYPPSASANGMLSKIVKQLGADAALSVVRAYVSSTKPYYVARKHDLKVLVQDAASLWIEIQQRTGGGDASKGPQIAVVSFVNAKGEHQRRLQDYPIDDPERIARKAIADYGRMVAAIKPSTVLVRIGKNQSSYSLEELRR